MQTNKPSISLTPPVSRQSRRWHGSRVGIFFLIVLIAIAGIVIGFGDWFKPAPGMIILQNLQFWQDHPPTWLTVPEFSTSSWLYLPTLLAWGITQIVMAISPRQKAWSRLIIVGLSLGLTLRYVLWRSLTTLNLVDPVTALVSIGIWGMEIGGIAGASLQLTWLLRLKSRRRQADAYAALVSEGHYQPTVDILIPSVNEPIAIIRRTLIGCQALDYAHKTIYLCDDGDRPEIADLCAELGCVYLARSEHSNAKAGNLNFAIAHSTGELIAVFDADFIPTQNFLTRTIGFFYNAKMGLVQSQHSFYNADPLACNLGLDRDLTTEVEIFSRYYQPLRDTIGSALCYGSSFVVRRSALAQVGGFVLGSLAEDYYTGIQLSAHGYQVIFLKERLSAGLLAESISAHILQRQRWARGTVQSQFIPSNPLTIPGLTFAQRLAHFEGISQWFNNLFRAVFLIVPPFLMITGIIPVRITPGEWIYYFIPFYLVQITTFGWLNFRSRSALFSDIYQVVSCLPISEVIIKTLIAPFSERFRVTPKGISQRSFFYNWRLALPLFLVLGLNLGVYLKTLLSPSSCLSETCSTDQSDIFGIQAIIAFFALYNLLVLIITLIGLLDVPKLDTSERGFAIATPILIHGDERTYSGLTRQIGEQWAEIVLDDSLVLMDALSSEPLNPEDLKPTSFKIEFIEENLCLQGIVNQSGQQNNGTTLRVEWAPMAIADYRRLVEIIFCRPGRWKGRVNPGELKIIALLITRLVHPVRLLKQARRQKIADA